MIGWKTISAAISAAALFGLFCAGCFFGHYWLWSQDVNRTAKINSQSYGAQSSDVASVNSDWEAITGDQHDLLTAPAGDAPVIKTELLGTANDLCFYYGKTTGTVQVSPDIVTWAQKNCSGGAVSATSTLRNGT